MPERAALALPATARRKTTPPANVSANASYGPMGWLACWLVGWVACWTAYLLLDWVLYR